MKKNRALSLMILGVGTLQAADPGPKQINQTVPLIPVRTKEAGVVTQRRLGNAIRRQEPELVKRLLTKQKMLDRTERNELLSKAQAMTDSYGALQNSPDYFKVGTGGLAVIMGLGFARSGISFLAKTTYSFVKSSFTKEKTAVQEYGEYVEAEAWDEQEIIDATGNYLLSAGIIAWGLRRIKQGLERIDVQTGLGVARSIERVIDNSIEVGKIPLNLTQD